MGSLGNGAVVWPETIEDVNTYGCYIRYHNSSLLVLSASGLKSWILNFSDYIVIIWGDEPMPIATHPAYAKGLISVLTRCWLTRAMQMYDMYIVTCTCDKHEHTAQRSHNPQHACPCPCTPFKAMMCAARVKCRRLKELCKKVPAAMKTYRFKHAMAKKIQRAWRLAISNPEYTLCRRRLLGEYAGLIGGVQG